MAVNGPAFRAVSLLGCASRAEIGSGLRTRLAGRLIALPSSLRAAEVESVVDVLAVLLGSGVVPIRDIGAAEPGRDDLIQVAVEPALHLSPVPGAVVVCVAARAAGVAARVDSVLPRELTLIRDALLDCVGRQASDPTTAALAGRALQVTDTPGTAIAYLDGAWRARARTEAANLSDCHVAGCAASVCFLLSDVDGRVIEWCLAAASGRPGPERLVGAEAALLGADAAWQLALRGGLAVTRPDGGGRPVFRLPLRALGGEADSARIWALLARSVDPAVASVARRLSRSRPRLALPAVTLDAGFVGREEELTRLEAMLAPAGEWSAVVVTGQAGIGKSSLARAVARRVEDRLQTVWLDLRDGPAAAWAAVADAVGVRVGELDERSGWLPAVHAALRWAGVLVVVDHADDLSDEALLPWLPTGAGDGAVLVLSRRRRPGLERHGDALTVGLAELSPAEADAMLRRAGHAPQGAPAAAAPLRLKQAAALRDLGAAAGPSEDAGALAEQLLDRLPVAERTVAEAIFSGEPSGVSLELVEQIAGDGPVDARVERLADRGIVERVPPGVALHGVVREALSGRLDEGRRVELVLRHAQAIRELLPNRRSADATRKGHYRELRRALEGLRDLVVCDERKAIDVAVDLLLDVLALPHTMPRAERRRAWELAQSLSGVQDPSAQLAVGLGWLRRPDPPLSQNAGRAIEVLRAALKRPNRSDPPLRARTLRTLAEACLVEGPGKAQERSKAARRALSDARRLVDREADPVEWARHRCVLARALLWHRMDARKALTALDEARRVFDDDQYPDESALIELQRATALRMLGGEPNLAEAERALDHALAGLACDDDERARASVAVERAHILRARGGQDLARAVETYREALARLDEVDQPWVFAAAQHGLGQVILDLPSGDKDALASLAVQALNAARRVYALEGDEDRLRRVTDDLRRAVGQT